MFHSTIFILFLSLFVFSCKKVSNKQQKPIRESIEKISTAENFEDFYEKFHQDSLFQINRIRFPLEGEYAGEDMKGNFITKKWNKEEWIMIKVPVNKIDTLPKIELDSNGDTLSHSQYKTSTLKSDSLVIEKVWLINSGYQVEIRYKLIDNKWFLFFLKESNI